MEKNSKLQSEYEQSNHWGISSSIDLYSCNPATIRDSKKIEQFVIELCDRIKMKRHGNCITENFGEDEKVAGYSMTQLIETSLISGHFANQTNNAYLDVFSCKFYEPKHVAEFAKEFFEAKEFKLNYLFRK